MARWHSGRWQNDHVTGPRRDRRSGDYRAYEPDALVGSALALEANTDGKVAAAERAGHAGRLSFVAVEPGPLPFADSRFDVVFSKDAIVHIPDKHTLAQEIFRVLAPGGVFAASDWMAGSDGPRSAAMQHYEQVEGLGFGLASPDRYFAALRAAGFERISYRDRTHWLRERTHRELVQLAGPLRPSLEASVGKEFLDHEVQVWQALCAVLDTAELGAGHWRARKSATS